MWWQSPQNLQRKVAIHSSAMVLGRKSGPATFEQAPRDFSKKQKRRHKKLGHRKSLFIDHARTKRRDRYMDEQYNEGKINDMVTDMTKNIRGVVKDLMLPEGQSTLLGDASEESERDYLLRLSNSIEPDNILKLLREESQFTIETMESGPSPK